MFRKLAIALAATATLGAAALAPTSASAHHRHYGWGAVAFGAGLIAAHSYYGGPGCYLARRWVPTPHGPRLRRFWVC